MNIAGHGGLAQVGTTCARPREEAVPGGLPTASPPESATPRSARSFVKVPPQHRHPSGVGSSVQSTPTVVQFSSVNSHPTASFPRATANRLPRASKTCRGHIPPMDRRSEAGPPRWTSGEATNNRRSRTWVNPPGKDSPSVQFSQLPPNSFLCVGRQILGHMVTV